MKKILISLFLLVNTLLAFGQACGAPRNITVNIVGTTATITWTGTGEVVGWDIFVALSREAQPNTAGNGFDVPFHPSTTYSFTMSPNTTYRVYIRGNCILNASPWQGSIFFKINEPRELRSWGINVWGNIGDNTQINRATPTPPTIAVNRWRQVESGFSHTVGIKDDGTLWAWGNNISGQLGTGATSLTTQLTPIQISSETDWVQIAVGTTHTLALKNNGRVYHWGYINHANTYTLSPTQYTVLSNISDIAAGRDHFLALYLDGTVLSWGYNAFGQLGDGTTTNNPFTILPTILPAFPSPPVQLTCGEYHSMALLADGTVRSWGKNDVGQLGDGSTTNRLSPVPVSSLTTVRQISAGDGHSMALLADGTLRTWGVNTYGQLGNATTTASSTPVSVNNINTATQIAAGDGHSMALLADGTLRTWGFNFGGRLGDGTEVDRTTPVEVVNTRDVDVVQIAGSVGGNALTNIPCPTPNTLSVYVNGTAATVNWFSTGSVTNWDVYVTSDRRFIPNRATPPTATITTQAYTFTMLPNTTYKVYVRNKCTNNSAWVGTVFFKINESKPLKTCGSNTLGSIGDGTLTNRFTLTLPLMPVGKTNLWRQVAGGANHTIGIKDDGTLWGWGSNSLSQFGDRTTVSRKQPVQINNANSWVQIATGNEHTLALDATGNVFAWGNNDYGQLGNGTTAPASEPSLIMSGVSEIAAGLFYSMALLSDGTIKAWGLNTSGQLGDGTMVNKTTPVQVSNIFSTMPAFQIVCGGRHSLAILQNGQIMAWGSNTSRQLGDGTTTDRSAPVNSVTIPSMSPTLKLAAGGVYSMALLENGTIKSWGGNIAGQLGSGVSTPSSSSTPISVLNINTATQISAGYDYALVLLANGTVKSWGHNTEGQLGDGTSNNTQNTPSDVLGITVGDATQVSAGLYTGYVLTSAPCSTVPTNLTATVNTNNTATITWTAGSTETAWDIYIASTRQDMPTRTSTPSVSNLTAATHTVNLAANTTYRVYVRAKCSANSDWIGSVFFQRNEARPLYSWGNNADYQHGANTTITPLFPRLPSLTNGVSNMWRQVAGGDKFTVAIKDDGTLWGWGYNVSGQVGDGTFVTKTAPVQISAATDWMQIAVGDNHTLALKSNGTVYSWGSNFNGQLGIRYIDNAVTPTLINKLTGVSEVAAGRNFSVALMSDGTISTWGNNTVGQLGNGNNNSTHQPIIVANINSAIQVDCGLEHTLALLADGTVKAWGNNQYAQLGEGILAFPFPQLDKSIPVSVSGVSNVKQVACGGIHSLALLNDGTIKSWGYGQNGELGDGIFWNIVFTYSYLPRDVLNITNATKIAAGNNHTLALLADGTVKSWGYNANGQLGDGTTTSQATPVSVNGINAGDALQIGAGTYTSHALTGISVIKVIAEWTWTGIAGDNNWTTPSNWTIGGQIPSTFPKSTESVIANVIIAPIDIFGGTPTIINVPNGIVLNSLTVSNGPPTTSTSVTLVGTENDVVLTLRRDDVSNTNPSLKIDNFGTLQLGGFNDTKGFTLQNDPSVVENIIYGTFALAGSSINSRPVVYKNATSSATTITRVTQIEPTPSRGGLQCYGSNSMVVNSNPSNLIFENNGQYRHRRDGGEIPNANYKRASIILVQDIVNTLPTFNANSVYEGNLEWSCFGQVTQADLYLPKGTGNGTRNELRVLFGHLSPIGPGTTDVFSAVKTTYGDFVSASSMLKINTPNFQVQGNFENNGGANIVLNGATSSLNVGGNFTTSRFAQVAGAGMLKKVGKLIYLPDFSYSTVPLVSKPVNVSLLQCQALGNCNTGVVGDPTNGFSPTVADPVTVEVSGVGANMLDIDLPPNIVYDLKINNPGGARLTAPLQVSKLDLTLGTLTTTATNLLTLTETATVTGGSTSTYVDGPIAKKSNATTIFTLPVGNALSYKPITFTPQNSNATTFQAQYFNTAPTNAALLTSPVNSLNAVGYYDVARTTGTANAKLGLTYSGAMLPNMLVAHYTTGSWRLEGGTPTIVSFAGGATVTTSNFVSSFSPFAIGFSNSVLPVELLDFKATPSVSAVNLTWQTASEVNTNYFDIERSTDGQKFEKIGETKALGKAANYAFLDKMLPTATTLYYRLKINDLDGKNNLSKTVSVVLKSKSTPLSIFPNPADKTITIRLETSEFVDGMTLTDMLGRTVFTKQLTSTKGVKEWTIDLPDLPSGAYWLRMGGEMARLVIR